ncbi:hypothetical protein SODALDRAFT_306370 [Sodiomyces alkalinus F11]|uniref:Uncharacterized protein n=1 Tax=Sodiomyces alkalinus (strain CBS 110278 / VKM F-3762 / F11) TaxID=1314773 RepID=A0A3N2Q0G7_SODAK|nr:hypothetical protein SODALDRAFT_306370 [Sodiomyces alkalinus F11]ROT40261.1 hypothetical protein SODALDRAFT_306370 [Sodiomyces alkalinus F11]
MASSITSATLPPRFLLPALSPMWRAAATRVPRTTTAAATIRNASTKSTSPEGKPPILEKPARFNPPSHGSRLPRNQGPKHYGGALSDAELRAQGQKHYPSMLPPEGTKAHSFIHNRSIHLFITLGTLTVLAISTFMLNFTHTSPFKHLLPEPSSFWSNPGEFIRTWIRVIQLHEKDRNEKVIAKHTRYTDDVAKREYYRKVHGLDKENPIVNLFKSEEQIEEERKAAVAAAAEEETMAAANAGGAGSETTGGQTRKKWLGIF